MSETETATLFVNESPMRGTASDLEKTIGNLDGVRSVELSAVDPQAQDGPLMVKRVTIAYDARSTDPRALREHLEGQGYMVTMLADVSD